MFTLVGYSKELDTGGELSNLLPLADQHVRVEGDNIIVPSALANLAGVAAVGANITAARLETPSLRRTLLLDIPYLTREAGPTTSERVFGMFDNVLPLDPTEPMRFQAAENAAGASRLTGLVWLSDGVLAPVAGDIFTVRASGSGTAVPYAWTNVTVEMGQTLPAGVYQVVGFSAHSANILAARLVFVGLASRPGVLATANESQAAYARFRRGGLGIWGEFEHSQPPTVDVLATAADTSFTFYFDLLKVA